MPPPLSLARPIVHAIPQPRASAQQTTAGKPNDRAPRMRWAPSDKPAYPLWNQAKASPQRIAQNRPPSRVKASTALALQEMLPALEAQLQRLERYDNKNLGRYGSVLRVPDHESVLSTEALMKLPGKISKGKKSASQLIAQLKTLDPKQNMPDKPLAGLSDESLLSLLSICRETHKEIKTLLDGLKRLNPLPGSHIHKADPDGNLIRLAHARVGKRSFSFPPLAIPIYRPDASFSAASNTPPDERAFIASLRSPASPPSPRANTGNATPSRIPVNKTRAQRQQQEIDRAARLWSTPAHEKADTAGALGATTDKLALFLLDEGSILERREPPSTNREKQIQAVSRMLKQIEAAKKKCEALDPADISPAARKCRADGRNINIRANNLLESLNAKKTKTGKQTSTSSPYTSQTPPNKQRQLWSSRPIFIPCSGDDSGCNSAESISPESSPPTMLEKVGSAPAKTSSSESGSFIPNWLLKHFQEKGIDPRPYRDRITLKPAKWRPAAKIFPIIAEPSPPRPFLAVPKRHQEQSTNQSANADIPALPAVSLLRI